MEPIELASTQKVLPFLIDLENTLVQQFSSKTKGKLTFRQKNVLNKREERN